jgi:predicted DNA-binding protein YlxM (UPF0122 family)
VRIVPELTLLDYLSADHQNLLEAEPDLSVAEVAQHLSVERDFLYPAISEHVADGQTIVEDLRHAERRLEERLKDFEKHPSPENRDQVQQAIGDHITTQEQLFVRLREVIPEPALVEPLESIPLSIGGAPTHAHPLLAEGGPLGKLIEDLTSAADHTIDHLHHKKDPESG